MGLSDRYALPSPEHFAGLTDEQLNNEVNGGMYVNVLATATFAGGCALLAADSIPSFVHASISGNHLETVYSFISFGLSSSMIAMGKRGIELSGLRVGLARSQRAIRRESGFSREAIE